MKINKAELLKALEIVKPGLSNKEMIEQATSFAFMKGRVITFNDEISLSHAVTGLEIEGAIKAEELYQLLGKMKGEDLDLELNGEELVITSGKSKAGLTLQMEIKLPLEEIGSISKWKALPENFIKHLSFCVPSCSKDMSRPVITGVHIDQQGIMEATDGFRITKCEFEKELPVKTFILPASPAMDVVKLKPTKIAEGKGGWIHFQTDEGTILSSRIFEDEFPNTEQFMTIEGFPLAFPKTTSEVLDRAAVFSKRDHLLDEMVTITLDKNRMKISSKSDVGWFEEDINLKYADEKFTIQITPYLLKGILSETHECTVGEHALMFYGVDWKYLTMLRA